MVMPKLLALVLLLAPLASAQAPTPLTLPHGVHPASEIHEVEDAVLRRFYPRLRFYVSEHDTDFFEYHHVRALTVVRDRQAPVTSVEHLFSHDGWPRVLATLRGARVADRAQTEALLGALATMLAPLASPTGTSVGTPEITLESARARLSSNNNWEVWLELRICEHRVCDAAFVQHHVAPQ
jgi:hypothetical protein